MQPTTELRQAARRLLRAPVFTATALLTLAVGIGANTAIFSVVRGVLLKPLPFHEPERLVGLWHTAPGLGFDEVNQSPATYLTYRTEARVFEDVGLWDNRQVSVTGLQEPEQVQAMLVTDGLLPLLGVRPLMGRLFTAEDDAPGAPETVILGHGYWQRAFGGDPGVVGRSLTVSGRPREIVGVLPPGFRLLRFDPAVYLPAQLDPARAFVGNFDYQGIGRLRPGATPEQAHADLERLIPLATERYPGPISLEMLREARFAPLVRPLKVDVVGDVGTVLWVLLGTVGMVLLVACANVANLFLVRAEGRVREVAVRTALGADRKRIAGGFLLESAMLGAAGGALGLALAYGGIRMLVGLAPGNLPRLEEIGLDPVVLAFTVAVSLLAGLLFGVFPVARYARPDLVAALKEGSRGASAGRERHRTRSALVVAQIALALVLLVGSGLMIRSFQALRAVDPGFRDPASLLTFRVSVPTAEAPEAAEAARVLEEIYRRLEAITGVASVGMTSSVTMDRWDSNDALWVEDHPTPPDQIPPIRRFKWIGGDYFGTMGNPVLAGRPITWADIHERSRVVVVTENLAREYWGEPAAALGRRVRTGTLEGASPVWREIVGVVGNVRDDGPDRPAPAVVYWPMAVADFWEEGLMVRRAMAYVLRSGGPEATGLLAASRDAVWSVNRSLPLADVRTVAEIAEASMARTSFTLVMLGIAAAVALLLGTVGIYGVVSYAVSQRTREIGVRMALGAERGHVSRMVVGQGLVLTALGVGVGLAAAAAVTRVMASLLHGVGALDPLTYAAVAAALAGVALLASWLPARRAAGVDPATALRWE